jgi:hypothetical protein
MKKTILETAKQISQTRPKDQNHPVKSLAQLENECIGQFIANTDEEALETILHDMPDITVTGKNNTEKTTRFEEAIANISKCDPASAETILRTCKNTLAEKQKKDKNKLFQQRQALTKKYLVKAQNGSPTNDTQAAADANNPSP